MHAISSIRHARFSSASSLLRQWGSLSSLPESLPGCLRSLKIGSHPSDDVGIFGKKVNNMVSKERFSAPYSLSFQSLIHSSGPKENEGWSDSMKFVKGILEEDNRGTFGAFHYDRPKPEQDAHVVHINLKRNNTFVTVTDSKGKKKLGISCGRVPELKGGGNKMSKYSAEATAEHAGRLTRNLGVKSMVMRVKGFTFFKKKRQAVLSFKEGFAGSSRDHRIICIEDATRRPHNGCRLPKRRRI